MVITLTHPIKKIRVNQSHPWGACDHKNLCVNHLSPFATTDPYPTGTPRVSRPEPPRLASPRLDTVLLTDARPLGAP